jgi:hypothetical protein
VLKTRWKSEEEIRYSLREAKRIALISCDFCSNISDTGSTNGIRYFTRILEGWGKEVVFSKSFIACCSESMMSRALSLYAGQLSRADMLVLLSCPSGFKAASLCDPALPFYCPLEVEGGVIITPHEETAAASGICSACGHCVISYTGGICPLNGCPAGQLYGPCENYPRRGTACTVDPGRPCVWKEIEKKGDMEALQILREMHEDPDFARLPGPGSPAVPPILKRVASWTIARVCGAGTFKLLRFLR